MIVIALEGAHGCGKTTMCEAFGAEGYNVMDEGFLDMPCHSLHPQSLVTETAWVSAWFRRVLVEYERDPHQILVSDRSPFSAVFYTENGMGNLLLPIIRAQMEELRALGIDVFTVYVSVHPSTLWERITTRLLVEPDRAMLKEDSRAWMEHVVDFYEQFDSWDLTIDNSSKSIITVANELVKSIRSKSPEKFDEAAIKSGCGSPLTSRVSSMAALGC